MEQLENINIQNNEIIDTKDPIAVLFDRIEQLEYRIIELENKLK